MLRANKGGNVDSQAMGEVDIASAKERSDKGGGKGVAGAYRISHFYAGGGKKTFVAGREDVTTLDAASQNDDLDREMFGQLATAFSYAAFQLEQMGHDFKFLIVDL